MADPRLHRRDVLGLAGAAALAGAVPARAAVPQAVAGGGGSRGGDRSNLVLFLPDEMRADALGCYGNPVCRTPNYDALARAGVRFADCHVQYPVCGASRCSLLTGWPASVHGHRSLYYFLRPDEPNMFRYLKQAGYDVYWFGKNDALSQASFPDSVTRWFDVPVPRPAGGAPAAPAEAQPFTMLMSGSVDRRATSDYTLLRQAIAVLEQKERDRPFCIFLPTGNPHPPYRAPDGFDTMYRPADLPPLVPPGLPGKPLFHGAIREAYRLNTVSDAVLRQVRATYYGQVSYADWLLGELLEAMERTGHARDTALFVSSDHGDYAGDYGLVEKWPSGLESCLTHVPLLARTPGCAAGHVVHETNEMFDIMPTVLDLAGTRAAHTHYARTMTPQLAGATGDPKRAALVEGGYNTYEPQAFEPRLGGLYAPKTNLQNDRPETVARVAALKTPDFSLVVRPDERSELYDRRRDPMETRNLIDDPGHAATRSSLQDALLTRYMKTGGVPPFDKDSREVPPYYPTPDLKEEARRGLMEAGDVR